MARTPTSTSAPASVTVQTPPVATVQTAAERLALILAAHDSTPGNSAKVSELHMWSIAIAAKAGIAEADYDGLTSGRKASFTRQAKAAAKKAGISL